MIRRAYLYQYHSFKMYLIIVPPRPPPPHDLFKYIYSFPLTISHAQKRRKTSCMADRQGSGVKSFINSVCCYSRQPVKTNSFNQIMEMQAYTFNQHDFVIPGSLLLIEVSYERAENYFFFKCDFLFEIQIPSAKLLFGFVSSNWFNYSCVKYASYKLASKLMKEEDFTFTNMSYILIVIVIKL